MSDSYANSYNEGYYDGMQRALLIVRATQAAPSTRCTGDAFGAAKRRIARVLAGAVARNEPSEVSS